MALARVVAFDGVTRDRIDRLRDEIEAGDRPDDVPATEIVILYDADAQSSLAILYFETEEDFARGDATLDAMPSEGTPGQRSTVRKYEVAIKRVV
jgi:hypothetical protein